MKFTVHYDRKIYVGRYETATFGLTADFEGSRSDWDRSMRQVQSAVEGYAFANFPKSSVFLDVRKKPKDRG